MTRIWNQLNAAADAFAAHDVTIFSHLDARGEWWLSSPDRQAELCLTFEDDPNGSLIEAAAELDIVIGQGFNINGWDLTCVPVEVTE